MNVDHERRVQDLVELALAYSDAPAPPETIEAKVHRLAENAACFVHAHNAEAFMRAALLPDITGVSLYATTKSRWMLLNFSQRVQEITNAVLEEDIPF